MKRNFIQDYLTNLSKLIIPTDGLIKQLEQVKDAIFEAEKNGKKIIIIGNGGSAAIASHFSIDLTKNANIRCVNFNEASLLTCFSNDYGYNFWAEKAIEFYGDEGDVLIAISSSGQSKNIINACNAAQKSCFSSIITLSGFNKSNNLSKKGNINLWLDSSSYNDIENIHQIWLLSIVDQIINLKNNK